MKDNSSVYDMENVNLIHHINQALKAHKIFNKDTDYLVKDNQVIIIDEFTGRMMEEEDSPDGLHQALEAKEGRNPARKQNYGIYNFSKLFQTLKNYLV